MVQHRQDTFEVNFDWQKGYYGKVRYILRRYAGLFISVEVAPQEEDTKHATDFVLQITGNVGSVACRVRRGHITYRDFTIRSRSKHGGKTELTKLREGFARWYLYAWSQPDGSIKNNFMLLDMDVVRMSGLLDIKRPETDNGDGTKFIYINTDDLRQHKCIMAAKGI